MKMHYFYWFLICFFSFTYILEYGIVENSTEPRSALLSQTMGLKSVISYIL